MSDHDDLFYEHVASVLAQLYERFPVKSDLDVDEISGFRNSHYCQEGKLAYTTIKWLEEEGYIRVGESRYPHSAQNCILTAKGFNRLQAIPEGDG